MRASISTQYILSEDVIIKLCRAESSPLRPVYQLNISTSVVNRCQNSLGLLKLLKELRIQATSALQAQGMDVTWLHPFNGEIKSKETDNEICPTAIIYFVSTKPMIQIMADAPFAEQREFVNLVGVSVAIGRHSQYKPSVTWYEFQKTLRREAIENNTQTGVEAKRIYAVHPLYMKDDEIRSGLRIANLKHPQDNTIYVESEGSLHLALEKCQPLSTLVIDGHWVHGEASLQGVWSAFPAAILAEHIANILKQYKGKVAHVILLGCQAGHLSDSAVRALDEKNLFIKSIQHPLSLQREMAKFRDRAIYISDAGEMPFDPDSLAGQLFNKIQDEGIAVTASHSNTYPYPVDSKAQFNIAGGRPSSGSGSLVLD